MLDHAIGPNVIKGLADGMRAFMEKKGFSTLEDFRGIRRDRVVTHSRIRRPDAKAYHGGYETEGYAAPTGTPDAPAGRSAT
jgi:dihydropyrimidine dehydrogenase (NAD+) subunit PreA